MCQPEYIYSFGNLTKATQQWSMNECERVIEGVGSTCHTLGCIPTPASNKWNFHIQTQVIFLLTCLNYQGLLKWFYNFCMCMCPEYITYSTKNSVFFYYRSTELHRINVNKLTSQLHASPGIEPSTSPQTSKDKGRLVNLPNNQSGCLVKVNKLSSKGQHVIHPSIQQSVKPLLSQ